MRLNRFKYDQSDRYFLVMLEQQLIGKEQEGQRKGAGGQGAGFRQKAVEMEGECRVQSIRLLQFNRLKATLLGSLLTISIVGLLLLKYFKTLRVSVFYNTLQDNDLTQATHVFVQGQQSTQQISRIDRQTHDGSEKAVFKFKQLRYELTNGTWVPLGINYVQDIEEYQSQSFLRRGLSRVEAQRREELYGTNEHKVEVPTYPEYLFDTMTQPLYLFQYFVSLVYALQSFYMFAFLMIFFGFVTTTINYILLRRSYNKIKETAQKKFKVSVLRDGGYSEVLNIELVPGDIYVPSEEIPCDSIVVRGEMFVDEVSLTGQNVPIAKFKLIDASKIQDKSHWLYEGSKLQTMKENALAMVVYVGYGSRRGRIIRHILTKVAKEPQFFKKIIFFQVEVLIVSIIVFLATLPRMFEFDIDPIMKILRFGDFITYSFPAPYPILFNLAYSFCLVRLNKVGVIGTEAEKTVEGSRLKTICFDKTGTLTQNKMQVASVYHIKSSTAIDEVTTRVNQYPMLSDLFACCNSVELIGREVKGDEIDLRLFEYVSARLQDSQDSGVVRELKVHGRTLQILRINQYESQFQSMSVLVRQPLSKKLSIFVKGSPEMIHNYSTLKFRGYDDFVKRLSFGGYRSIAFGCKSIDEEELPRYLSADREAFLKETSIFGVVTFINRLKDDAASTLTALGAADITTKIITGDNIFLGIQTAFATGIIQQDKTVVVLEGSRYDHSTKSADLLYLTRSPSGEISEHRKLVESFEYPLHGDEVYAIDNDFIRANPEGFLSDRVKVFARISPQNKALIVRKHREREQAIVSSRKGLKKLTGDCSFKVGMVGDGANDLIAIKQADVGIGISSSDAIYSAAFAVKDLSQILEIVLESKNAERLINQMAKYYGITQFLSIVNTVILTEDCSYFTTYQLLYKNFVNTLLITLFFGTCRPLTKLKKFIPNSNFLDLENHLVFWGNLLITTLGLVASYGYYSNSDDFQPNETHRYVHFEDGWFGDTKSSTINFIAAILTYIVLAFLIYQGKPWKKQIWTNKPLFVVLLVNAVLILVISFTTSSLSSFQIRPIALKELSVVYAIIGLTAAVAVIFNLIIDKLCFRSPDLQRSELSESLSLIQYS